MITAAFRGGKNTQHRDAKRIPEAVLRFPSKPECGSWLERPGRDGDYFVHMDLDLDFVLPSGKKLRDATSKDLDEAAAHYFLEAKLAEARAEDLRQAAGEISDGGQYVIRKALAYVIEAIDHLPEAWRAITYRNDMEHFLKTITCEKFATTLRTEARAVLEHNDHGT